MKRLAALFTVFTLLFSTLHAKDIKPGDSLIIITENDKAELEDRIENLTLDISQLSSFTTDMLDSYYALSVQAQKLEQANEDLQRETQKMKIVTVSAITVTVVVVLASVFVTVREVKND